MTNKSSDNSKDNEKPVDKPKPKPAPLPPKPTAQEKTGTAEFSQPKHNPPAPSDK